MFGSVRNALTYSSELDHLRVNEVGQSSKRQQERFELTISLLGIRRSENSKWRLCSTIRRINVRAYTVAQSCSSKPSFRCSLKTQLVSPGAGDTHTDAAARTERHLHYLLYLCMLSDISSSLCNHSLLWLDEGLLFPNLPVLRADLLERWCLSSRPTRLVRLSIVSPVSL